MSRRVQAVTGVRGLTLPNGWELDGGDEVVVSDSVWAQIEADVETLGRLSDLGTTTDLPDEVPTWRDIQRATAGGSTGLEDEVDALNTALGAHIADTTGVHGIGDTALLETQTGAQSKADAAQADAEAAAAAALSAHNLDTTGVHGISDTSLLALRYEQTFNFAIPLTTWTISHGQDTKALNVELFNDSGDPMVAEINYPDNNTITAEYYYPTSGSARVFGLQS